MSADNKKEIVVPKFDAGFNSEKKGEDTIVNVYKDTEVYASHVPLPKKDVQELRKFEKGFNSAFVAAAVKQAETDFKKNKGVEVSISKAQNGLTSLDNITVQVRKEVTTNGGFGGNSDEKNTAPQIKVKIKGTNVPGKTELGKLKGELHESLIKAGVLDK